MSRQPLDKGRVVFVAEKYQVGNQTKNRYAAVGRATKWPGDNGTENVEIELDTVPVGHQGSLKLFIFWDSESNQQNNMPPDQYNQAPPQGYQQQPPPQNYQQQPPPNNGGYGNRRG